MNDSTSLTNHLLIAMPTLADPNFSQSVTIVCEHTDKGALGIVVNKPLPEIWPPKLELFPTPPAEETLVARICPFERSCTKQSKVLFKSFGTR